MTEILDQINLSPFLIILIYILGIATTELWKLLKTSRMNAFQNISMNIIKELDNQLQNFYLPICERLKITKELLDLTQRIGVPYKNDSLKIESKNPLALRDIMVNKLFIPFNKEIENVILNNLQLKHPDDPTNYDKIVRHYRFWNALEESKTEKIIDNYDASDYLKFPTFEADSCQRMCDDLLDRRENIRRKILSYKGINKSLLLTKKLKNEKPDKIQKELI